MCDDCSICLEVMVPGTRHLTGCKHMFHVICIRQLERSGAILCPLCRTQIFEDPEEEEDIEEVDEDEVREILEVVQCDVSDDEFVAVRRMIRLEEMVGEEDDLLKVCNAIASNYK